MLSNRHRKTRSGTSPYAALAGVYTVDPVHSRIGFSVRHAMITNVRGTFGAFEGLLQIDGARPARSKAYLSVQTDSLDTGMRDRDAHLMGPDIFDSSTFPLMTFRSTGLVPVGDDGFRMSGDLRIKDVELPVTVDLAFGGAGRDLDGKRRVGFEGTATLQRSDWGLTWNAALETGGVLVGDKVRLDLDISAVQVGLATAA
ncbi:YceI family protein [Streptomyces sp. Tue6028]|uniref:YceI family protein n=1 Tax=Streptomyces sp. Tue6028 TaxID=2036037 RepID=UPI003D71F426